MAIGDVTDYGIGPDGWYRHGYLKHVPTIFDGVIFGDKVIVPGGEIWIPVSFTTSLNTTAAVANRSVVLTHRDADNNVIQAIAAGTLIPASSMVVISFVRGVGAAINGMPDAITAPMFAAVLRPGDAMVAEYKHIQGGDVAFNEQVTVFALGDGPTDYPTGRGPYVAPVAF